ncbi:MAG: hypothetical protein FJX44_10320 [Alphaproteobacteria bacterium]|nr:hypothetical protein [Alphaproteobacteria bacterium]
MRAVAGPGNLTTPGELDRHLALLSRLAESAIASTVTLILRAPDSIPAKALIDRKDELARAGVTAKAILAKLEPETELRQLYAVLSSLSPHEPATMLIRYARNPRLHDAHEQTTYGDSMCWSGDAMRRDADKRNSLSLFHEDDPDRTLLACHSFAALWMAATPVPARHLSGDIAHRPLGEYERPPNTPVAIAPFPGPQGWPLIRH